ncbi:MAG TPA: hypothetical protein VLQ90_14465 [Pyrinomonadaceae bacterium]|nr:hypothetical protein [Pyrinomonadaceae bacterium]
MTRKWVAPTFVPLHEGNEMTISTIDKSQQTAARVAGFTCLVTAIVVFANYLGISKLSN